METQNLTLRLPRSLVRKAKVVAAKRSTSISALLTASLNDLVREEDDHDSAMKRLLDRARKGFHLGTGGRPLASRHNLHER
jgi:predicted transcriptional regulator